MFRRLDDMILVAPQIDKDAVAAAKAEGVRLIINNRPEGESPDQTPGADIAAAALAEGIAYIAIPVAPGGFSEAQVSAMVEALDKANGPVLAYCRSGTRSTLLWALAQSSLGEHPAELNEKATEAGYDLSPVAPLMDMLRSRA